MPWRVDYIIRDKITRTALSMPPPNPETQPTGARRIDPWASLGAAVGWLVLALSLGIGTLAGLWAGHRASEAVMARESEHLQALADQVAGELAQGILLRQQALRATAAILGQHLGHAAGDDLPSVLRDMRLVFPEFIAIEAFDRDGRNLGKASGQPLADNQGLQGRYIAQTVAIRNVRGAEVGTLVGRLDWTWANALAPSLAADFQLAAGEEWVLADDSGSIQISSNHARIGQRLPDDGELLSVTARPSVNPDMARSGWQVSAVQPLSELRHEARLTGWKMFFTIFALGLAGGACGLLLGRRLTRRITQITDSAEEMLAGKVRQIAVPPGRDEASRLAEVLSRLFASLDAERAALTQLNAELDRRVVARTLEIERLAEESRYAETFRERLRLARDLHDTLGHSMMAMVAQIRVLKRLAVSDPAALPAELEQAEETARLGLAEARAAITQMRFNAVRDIGLGASLAEHLQRFSARTGIQTRFDCAPAMAGFAQASAETLFRMVEEGLRNVERHAGASQVELRLAAGEGDSILSLTLSDNGCGFDPAATPAGHFGLTGLKEHAGQIGAHCQIDSAPGGGTRIEITLPISYPE